MNMTSIDTSVLLFIQEYLRADIFDEFWKAVTFLGNVGWFWILLGIMLTIPKKTRKVGAAVLVSLVLNFLITNVALKNIVARTRPFDANSSIIPLIPKPHDFSFPSGHTSTSFAGALICYRMLPTKYGIAAVVLATLIGLSRLYLGVHYPSDVIGGVLVGLFCSTVAYRTLNRTSK